MPIQATFDEPGSHPVKSWASELDEGSAQQLRNMATLPFIHKHVAAMPDAHLGIGATVGSVIATRKAIIPAAVGVDIGCGMIAARTSLMAESLDESLLAKLFAQITRDVPVGRASHRDNKVLTTEARPFEAGLKAITERSPGIVRTFTKPDHWVAQMGTLGGGNHFIEICLDEVGGVWVMLHSGSRGTGNAIGRYFTDLARDDMRRQGIELADRDLAYFEQGSPNFDAYFGALEWAQAYAASNRNSMMELVLAAMRRLLPAFGVSDQALNCHHNYVSREIHVGEEVLVTRKGAIRAGEGELGIIPGSMGARSFIVRGKGNPDSFCSCSHGAGRKMSRTAATKYFTVADLAEQTEGVVCRKDAGVLDEIPGAYKDIDVVMANQSDLVEVVHTLKQVLCVKG